jgi:RNA polymerase sigma-70 factor (ECF subfamily)
VQRLDQLDDAVLTDRARDGDPRAFEALARRYQRPLFVLATRITGSAADGEDAVQLAFVKAWRTLPSFRGEARFPTWMYRIVTNEALTVLRRRKPVDVLPEDGDLRAPDTNGPEAAVQQSALATALGSALAALSPDLRVAWLLREAEQCSYEEVAHIVGTTQSTVRGRIARARVALAKSLAEWQ